MWRIFGADVVAIINGLLAAVVGKIVAAVVTLSTADIRGDNDAISNFQPHAFKIYRTRTSSDGSDRANVLMALNNRERNATGCSISAILAHIPLVCVFIGPTDAGNLH